MTPWQTYQQDLKRDDFVHDAAQENAVRHLQRLYDDLTQAKPKSTGFFANLFGKNEPEPIKGLYFWGGVGRGKTYLVGISLSPPSKSCPSSIFSNSVILLPAFQRNTS